MVKYLWDQNSQGNRYVILNEETEQPPEEMEGLLKTSVEYCQNKPEDDKFRGNLADWRQLYDLCHPKTLAQLNSRSKEFKPNMHDELLLLQAHDDMFIQARYENLQRLRKKGLRTTKQESYFSKGLYLNARFNKFVVMCRKERHFFDFGKKMKEDEELNKSVSYSQYVKTRGGKKSYYNTTMNSSRARALDQSVVMANRKVNTPFPIMDSMLTLSPVTYDQYQVLLQTCFHLQNFNEFLVIEGFINKTFTKDKNGNDMYCLLDSAEQGPAAIATDLFRTIHEVQADRAKKVDLQRSQDVQMRDISVPFERARVRHVAGKNQPIEIRDHDDTILEQ